MQGRNIISKVPPSKGAKIRVYLFNAEEDGNDVNNDSDTMIL